MESRLLINIYDPVVKFCVSFVTISVAEIGAKRAVAAWNAHPIDGKYSLLTVRYVSLIAINCVTWLP